MLLSISNGGNININELKQQLSEIGEALSENDRAMEELEKPWEQKLKEE